MSTSTAATRFLNFPTSRLATWTGQSKVGLHDHASLPRHALRIIGGPQQAAFAGEIIQDLLLIPCVVARGDCGQTHAKQFLGQLWRDSKPSRRIFAVSYHDVDLALGDEARHHS